MISVRRLRDLFFCFLGAGLALAAVMIIDPRRDGPAAGPGSAGPIGELAAWTLRDRAQGLSLLRLDLDSGIAPCELPARGELRPVLDRKTGLPTRVRHWLEGGARLWVMTLTRDPSHTTMAQAAEPDPVARCPDGRVLVPADTIMNFFYKRSAQRAGVDS
jgi:hypothetical protein